MNDYNNNFFVKNIGAIIGGIIGIILSCTGLYRAVLVIVAMIAGAYFGRYIQYNKQEVKEKTKNFIDKL